MSEKTSLSPLEAGISKVRIEHFVRQRRGRLSGNGINLGGGDV
jgi:hypothetical protein